MRANAISYAVSPGWIKICGMTTEEAVSAAIDAGADAIGFVFAPSVRQLTPQRAAELAQVARDRIHCIAVTRHPSQSLVDEIVGVFRPDVLQTDIEDFDGLRLPSTLPRLPVLRAGAGAALGATLPERLLFEGPHSGTGQTCDWSEAATLARRTELIVAGGLTAANVAAAIREVKPFGVDTSSGVEGQPGIKHAAKIAGFIAAARAAFSERVQS
jgi:phosphoribosylanthranilate isomerase